MLRQVLVLCAAVALASAFLERAQLEPVPEKYKGQQGCYFKELDTMVAFGESVPSKQRCVEYRCSKDGVVIAGCSPIDVTPPCVSLEEKDKPYPDCCPKLKC